MLDPCNQRGRARYHLRGGLLDHCNQIKWGCTTWSARGLLDCCNYRGVREIAVSRKKLATKWDWTGTCSCCPLLLHQVRLSRGWFSGSRLDLVFPRHVISFFGYCYSNSYSYVDYDNVRVQRTSICTRTRTTTTNIYFEHPHPKAVLAQEV